MVFRLKMIPGIRHAPCHRNLNMGEDVAAFLGAREWGVELVGASETHHGTRRTERRCVAPTACPPERPSQPRPTGGRGPPRRRPSIAHATLAA
jgi:hypothetical protein